MKYFKFATLSILAGIIFSGLQHSALAQSYQKLQKVSEALKSDIRPWRGGSSSLKVPMIAWGGDIQTILANGMSKKTTSTSHFAKAGLNIELFREDQFLKQLAAYLKAETPFLRGTLGMINSAAEVTNSDPNAEMVIIYQLTWSAGSDVIVVKDTIQKPADLKGKTIAIQSFGPHIDYLTTVLSSANLTPQDITWKWVPDLFEVDARSFSPAMALTNDSSVDGAMVIMPDAQILTSGGNIGNGAEGSVKGGKILMSTKTADRVIADVYAVRKDFLKKYPDTVNRFVKALIDAEAEARNLSKTKSNRWKELMRKSAALLLDDQNAFNDMEQMYYEADFAGIAGNYQFFVDSNYPRRAAKLNEEIQSAFVSLKLLSSKQSIGLSPIDFESLSSGGTMEIEVKQHFNPDAVNKLIARRQSSNGLDKGELFSFEIFFAPNQKIFPPNLYSKEFDKAIELISTYGGALMTLEGHSDPMGYLKKKKDNEPKIILERYKKSAQNLSVSRANSVRESLVSYAGGKGVLIDVSQFAVIGHGVMKPNTPTVNYDRDGDLALESAPRTKEQWDATRRVVFRILQVEAEEEAFTPLF